MPDDYFLVDHRARSLDFFLLSFAGSLGWSVVVLRVVNTSCTHWSCRGNVDGARKSIE